MAQVLSQPPAAIAVTANSNWSTCNGGVAPAAGDDITVGNGATLTVEAVIVMAADEEKVSAPRLSVALTLSE